MRHKKRTWIVENTWKCSSCEHKNKGRYMKCQNCGSPKEKHEKYDTSGNLTAPAVTDSEMIRQAKAGKNWECEYCGGSVRNLYGECQTCGGPKTEAAEKENGPIVRPGVHLDDTMPGLHEAIAKEQEPEEERVFVPNTGGLRTAPESYPKKTQQSNGGNDGNGSWVKKLRKRNWKPFIIGASIVLALAATAGLITWVFMPHEEHVTVASTQWVYLAHLQQRETRHGTGWDETVPSGAFNESCSTRQRGTENCRPHDCNPHTENYSCRPHSCNCRTTCTNNGNGYSTCSETCSTCYDTCTRTVYDTCYDQCPVYDQWCSYDYYAWPTIRTERLSGNAHQMREPVLEADPTARPPQRVVREHQFSVMFENEEDSWEYNPESVSDYNRFVAGSRWLIEVNHAGGVYPQHSETSP